MLSKTVYGNVCMDVKIILQWIRRVKVCNGREMGVFDEKRSGAINVSD